MTTRDPAQVLEAPGLACVSLTPLIKRTISGLEHGDVLEVHTDDPAARVGVPSWCRLTRNPLLDAVEHDPTSTTFHIQTNHHKETTTS